MFLLPQKSITWIWSQKCQLKNVRHIMMGQWYTHLTHPIPIPPKKMQVTWDKLSKKSYSMEKDWQVHGWIFGKQSVPDKKGLPSGKVTWQWQIPILCRKYIFQWSISRCYVSFPECNYLNHYFSIQLC